MSDATKASRISRYQAANFGGTVEWAIDLAEFVDGSTDPATTTSGQVNPTQVDIITLVAVTGSVTIAEI